MIYWYLKLQIEHAYLLMGVVVILLVPEVSGDIAYFDELALFFI